MLRMRRVLARTSDGYLVLPRGRPLVSYYANSIAHLLGPFVAAVQKRDALPVASALRDSTEHLGGKAIPGLPGPVPWVRLTASNDTSPPI
jgi:hypothetical protein